MLKEDKQRRYEAFVFQAGRALELQEKEMFQDILGIWGLLISRFDLCPPPDCVDGWYVKDLPEILNTKLQSYRDCGDIVSYDKGSFEAWKD